MHVYSNSYEQAQSRSKTGQDITVVSK